MISVEHLMEIQERLHSGDNLDDVFNDVYELGRADAIEEVYDRIDAGVCEICDCKDFDNNCYKHCQEEMRVVMKWLKEQKE